MLGILIETMYIVHIISDTKMSQCYGHNRVCLCINVTSQRKPFMISSMYS